MTLRVSLSSQLSSYDVAVLLTNSADVSVMSVLRNDKNAMYISLMSIVEVPSLVPRLSLSPPTESLGMRLGGSILLYTVCRVSYRILSFGGGGGTV